ncbi:MAG: hypothetical protein ACRDRG_06625 [Pseudonocardiaceae bacterium]
MSMVDRGAPDRGACPVRAGGLPPCEARILNGSTHAIAEPAQPGHTVLAYLQLVLRQAAMSRSPRRSRSLHGRFVLSLGAHTGFGERRGVAKPQVSRVC